MEIDLTSLGISFVNMTTSSADELRRALESTPPPEIILTNVEGVGDKAKRDVLRRSPVTIGHIAWDEAMVRKEAYYEMLLFKGAGASEAPGQTKEEFSINDTSRHPKLLKIGPQYG